MMVFIHYFVETSGDNERPSCLKWVRSIVGILPCGRETIVEGVKNRINIIFAQAPRAATKYGASCMGGNNVNYVLELSHLRDF